MGKLVLSDVAFWYGTHAIKSDINEVQLAMSADEVDFSNMGSSGWKEFQAGLVRGGVSFAGFFEAAQPDAYLSGQHTLGDVPVTVGPEGGADGGRVFITKPLMLTYNRSGNVGEAFKISVAGPANEPIVSATCLGNGTYTSTTTGTGRQIGAVGASEKAYAALHCLSASAGDTCDVTIESDDNASFTSPTTRFTFTQISGGTISSEWKSLAGAITDDYWRAVVTIAGDGSESFELIISLGVK